MRLLVIVMVFGLFYCVTSKVPVKALTESMGQEIIEIGTPVKELPPQLEEEPSAEEEVDYKQMISSSPTTARKKENEKETKRISTTATTTSQRSQPSRRKEISESDEEDAKVERELAAMYKDTNIDYKDIEKKESVNVSDDKPILRNGNSFKFQPDINNPREVERFRTSVDDITCDQTTKVNNRLKAQVTDADDENGNGAIKLTIDLTLYVFSLIIVNC